MRSQRRPAAVPSLMLRGARLVPVRGTGATPEDEVATDAPMDVLVIDGRIVEVGERLARPQGVAEHLAEGRWLMPVLWDQLVHLGHWTLV